MVKILVKVTDIKLSYQLSGLTEIEFKSDQQLSMSFRFGKTEKKRTKTGV